MSSLSPEFPGNLSQTRRKSPGPRRGASGAGRGEGPRRERSCVFSRLQDGLALVWATFCPIRGLHLCVGWGQETRADLRQGPAASLLAWTPLLLQSGWLTGQPRSQSHLPRPGCQTEEGREASRLGTLAEVPPADCSQHGGHDASPGPPVVHQGPLPFSH